MDDKKLYLYSIANKNRKSSITLKNERQKNGIQRRKLNHIEFYVRDFCTFSLRTKLGQMCFLYC